MSIKQNIAEAREEIKELASRIYFHEGVIQKEKEKVSELEEKIKLLTTRKSELAQVVLKKMQCEHEWVLRKIQEDEEVLVSLYNEKKEREDRGLTVFPPKSIRRKLSCYGLPASKGRGYVHGWDSSPRRRSWWTKLYSTETTHRPTHCTLPKR